MLLDVCADLEDETVRCRCQAAECLQLFNDSIEERERCYLEECFISKRALDDSTLYQVTALYAAIMAVGIIGNLGTCIVIRRHPLLNTHSSVYLLNLAVSDLVTLCVGLPFEIFMNWNQYPWPFPDFFCNLKALIAETTSSVSILTILLFSIERYIAICHPFCFVKIKPFRKHVWLPLLATWVISIACAVPFARHHTADLTIQTWPYTKDGPPIYSSKMCMLVVTASEDIYFELKMIFHFSAIAFFLLPLSIILILYMLIACTMKTRQHSIVFSRADSMVSEDKQLRVTVILTAVVIAFFVCYLPFQIQRLSFFYVEDISILNQYVYFISGFLFYLATVVNPILYNLVSSRFRKASKEVLCFFLCNCSGGAHIEKYTAMKLALAPVRFTETMHLRSSSTDHV